MGRLSPCRCRLTHASLKDATPGSRIESGGDIVVGDHDADPVVAQVMDIKASGVVLLRVLPGHANQHLDLLARHPA